MTETLDQRMSYCPFKHDDMTGEQFKWFSELIHYVGKLEQDSDLLQEISDELEKVYKSMIVDTKQS